MAIRVTCPKCRKAFSVQDSYAARHFKCPGCKKKIRMPDPKKDRLVKATCSSCGGEFPTWTCFLEAGMKCPLCGKRLAVRKEEEEEKEEEIPVATPVLEAAPEASAAKAKLAAKAAPVVLVSADEQEAPEAPAATPETGLRRMVLVPVLCGDCPAGMMVIDAEGLFYFGWVFKTLREKLRTYDIDLSESNEISPEINTGSKHEKNDFNLLYRLLDTPDMSAVCEEFKPVWSVPNEEVVSCNLFKLESYGKGSLQKFTQLGFSCHLIVTQAPKGKGLKRLVAHKKDYHVLLNTNLKRIAFLLQRLKYKVISKPVTS